MRFSKVRRLCGHVAVLARATLFSAERRRLLGLRRVLCDAAAAYHRDGLPALAAAAEQPPRTAMDSLQRGATLAQADTLAAILRTPPFRYCMRRAVLRFHVLRATGASPVLVIGVERAASTGELDGHAWVELEGRPFREEDDRPRRMKAIFRHPADPSPNLSP